VVMKQIITDSAGNTVNQTKTVVGYCTTYNGCGWQSLGNNIFNVGLNSNTDYTIKSRFEFNSTVAGNASYSGTHNAADLKLPSLTITYDNNPTPIAVQNIVVNDAQELVKDIAKEIEKLDLPISTEPKIEIATIQPIKVKQEIKIEAPIVEVVQEIKIKPVVAAVIVEEKKEAPVAIVNPMLEPVLEEKKEKPVEIAAAIIEETKQEIKEEIKEEKKDVIQEEKSKQKTDKTKVATKKEKVLETKTKTEIKATILAKALDKVDTQVKDITKNLETKSILKVAAIQNTNLSLDGYKQTIFYKPKNIYTGQIFKDNRLIYNNVSLTTYVNKDPINIKNQILQNINIQKQRLLIEIRELKNG